MIFAFNTSTTQFSAALMREDGTTLSEYFISSGTKNFTGFMPAIHFLLQTSNSKIRDIKAIIAATGPGSYTGLRVGLAAAKGMAQGLRIPIMGIPSLKALAIQLPYSNYPICPIIDSRKGEVFTALFNRVDDNNITRTEEDTCLKIGDLSTFIRGTTIFIGNNYEGQGPLIKEMLGTNALLAPAHLWNLRASAIGVLGLERFHENDFDDLQDLVPTYFRPPDIRPGSFPIHPE